MQRLVLCMLRQAFLEAPPHGGRSSSSTTPVERQVDVRLPLQLTGAFWGCSATPLREKPRKSAAKHLKRRQP